MTYITIQYFGILHELVGKRSEVLRMPNDSSLNDLLDRLAAMHGKRFKEFVFGQGNRPRKGLAFAANGDTIPMSKLRTTKCESVSEFVILPPISGGVKLN